MTGTTTTTTTTAALSSAAVVPPSSVQRRCADHVANACAELAELDGRELDTDDVECAFEALAEAVSTERHA